MYRRCPPLFFALIPYRLKCTDAARAVHRLKLSGSISIEMLVVVAILAVAMAILLPALHRARQRALRLRYEHVAWHLAHRVEDARIGDIPRAKLIFDHARARGVPNVRTRLLGDA